MITYEGYYIKKNPLYPNIVYIVTKGRGGKIPDVMKGMFTSEGVAKKIIDDYLKLREERERTTNASKADPKSGS